jgi:plasmid replication initiation protein
MLKENEYKQFCDFRRWVLKPAQKELSEKTDITFEWKEERQNQKCISIEFIITKQLRNNTINTLLIEEETKKVERIAQTKEIKHECKKIADLLFELGISSEMSKELAENHMEEEIRLAIDYTKTLQTEGKIKNPAGFLVDAIRKGFRDNHAEERKRKEETVKAKENKEALRKEWERMKTRWNAWRVERVEAYMASLDAETLDREKALFRESLKGSVMAKAIYSNPESEARHFRIYQTGKMLGLGLLEWAQEVGVDMTPFMEYARFEGKL